MNTPAATDLRDRFIEFLVRSGALTFGSFTTKSGRATPYFINTGRFDTGAKIDQLGAFYAEHIVRHQLEFDALFGPAYKGIPLCVATAAALHRTFDREVGFCFNRKEAKQHGDGGDMVGMPLRPGMRVVLVEDVITAGTTLNEVLPVLRAREVQVSAVVIAVDRCERGSGAQSAVAEAHERHGVPILPLLTAYELLDRLRAGSVQGVSVDDAQLERIGQYLATYGVQP